MKRSLLYIVGGFALTALAAAAFLIGVPTNGPELAAYAGPAFMLAGVMANAVPEQFHLVQMAFPQTTNGGFTSDVVSLKGAHKATIIIDLNNAVSHATAFSLRQATDAAAGTSAAGPATARIWANEDVAASDTLVKQTSAASFTVATGVKKKQIVFEVDAAELTDGYPYIYFTAADSSQATNFASATVLLHTRYEGAVAGHPTAIT